MMTKLSKRMRGIREKVDSTQSYAIEEALSLLQQCSSVYRSGFRYNKISKGCTQWPSVNLKLRAAGWSRLSGAPMSASQLFSTILLGKKLRSYRVFHKQHVIR